MASDHDLIDSVLDAVAAPLLVCREDRTVFANDAAEALTGYSRNQLQSTSLKRLLPAYSQPVQPNNTLPAESTLTTADGHILHVQIHASSVNYDGAQATLLTLQDVTQARLTEERYRAIDENTIDIVVVTNGKGKVVSVSPTIQDILGYSEHDLLNTNSLDLMHPDDVPVVTAQMSHLTQEGKPGRAEIRLRHKDGSYVWVESLVGLVQRRDGSEIHNVSLVRDIHERKQAEEALRHTAEQLQLITDHMSDVVSRITPDGKIVYVSPSCYATFGYTADEMIGQMGFELVHPDDLATTAARFQQAIETHKTEVAEVRYRHKDGHYVWIESSAKVIYDAHGQITSLIAISRDITWRKQTEEQLGQSQHLLQQITQMVPLDIYIYDLNLHKNIFHNRDTNLGYPLESISQSGENFYANLVHPDDRAKHAEKSQRLMKAKDGELIESEDRMLHASGAYRWYYFRDTVFARNPDGSPSQFLGSMLDITVRKEAEAALLQNDQRLRLITDNMSDVVAHVTADGSIAYTSPSCLAMFGYQPSEMMGQPALEYVHPDDLAMAIEKFQLVIVGQKSEAAEYRFRHKDGHYVWVESSGSVVCDETGQVIALVSATRDISHRKRTQDQLRLITDNIGDVVSRINLDGITAYTSPSCYAIFGYRPEELIGQMGFERIHPDDLAAIAAGFQNMIQTHTSDTVEYRYLHKDGHYVWVETTAGVIYDSNGQVSSLISTSRDITQRKQAEDLLRKSEEKFRLLANNSTDMIAQLAEDGRIQYITPSSFTVLGYAPEEMVGQLPFDFIHPDDRDYVIDKFQGVLAGLTPYFIEFRAQHKAGHYVWLELNTRAIYQSPGVVDHMILAMRDVSARKKTEETLRANEEQYRLLANNSTDMIGLHELDGTCLYASPSIESQTGWSVEDVVGKAVQEHIHPEDLERVFSELTEGFMTGNDATVEYRFQCKDGSYIWVETQNRMTYRPDGTPPRVVATTRNITARKQAEMGLKENEARLRLVTDNMSDVIVQISPRGLIGYVSPSSREVLGYEPDELINEPTLIRIHADDQPLVAQKFQSAYLNRKAETLEVRYRHKAGNYVWVELSGMVIVSEDGEVRGLVASLRNIEARKQAHDALRESETRLRLITDNIHDLVSLTDGNLMFRYASPSFRDILGYEADELSGKSIFELVHADDLPLVLQKAQAAIERHGSDTAECRFQHKDGYYIWIEVNGSVIVEDDNTITGAVFTARDISERRWMQRAHSEHDRLLGALTKQQELNTLKNRMMSRLSHELRTPLAVIATSADLLEHYAHRMSEDQRKERLQQIRLQIKHFVGLLDNMSLVVKGSNYSGEFAPTPYDLEKLCHTVIEEVKDTLHATHTIDLKLEGDIKLVNSDEKLMRIIVTHLLSNALKFSPGDSTITLNLKVGAENLLFTISDQGIGIPADDRAHIFDAFVRASNVEEAPGLGIGLSIVNDAVNSVHGKISVQSEVGRGTQMTVEIPLHTEALPDVIS